MRAVWNPFRRRESLEERQITAPWILDLPDWQTTGNAAGEHVSSTSVLGLSAAWSAVGRLAHDVATLPVDVVVSDGETSRVLPGVRPAWLDEPGGGITRIDLLTQVMMSLLVSKHGEAFILTPRDAGQIQGLVVLDPDQVQPDTQTGQWSSLGQPLGPGELVVIRGLVLPGAMTSYGSWRGCGPVGYAREVFGGALATQKFGNAFFGNGAWTGTVIEVPGELGEVGQKALKAYIEERHRGAGRAHKIGILINGAKLSRPITFSPEDSQFLQSREFDLGEVARMFWLDPSMIGGKTGDSLTYSTLEGRGTHYVKFSLLHWLVRLETAFTTLWQSEGNDGEIRFNVEGLKRGSQKERADTYAQAIRDGWMTVDEVRALENLPPLGAQEDMRNLVEMVQKIYLGVGTVMTSAEAREILNRAGANLQGPGPADGGGNG
jgi:HK97 family phage portal protein